MTTNFNSQRNESPSEVTTATDLGAMHRDPNSGVFVATFREGDSADEYAD